MAVRFIEHALKLTVPHVAMLLRNDFDSAIGRQQLFRFNPMFAGKLVLLNRIKWSTGRRVHPTTMPGSFGIENTPACHRSVTSPERRQKMFACPELRHD
jgi:hypothetical protein